MAKSKKTAADQVKEEVKTEDPVATTGGEVVKGEEKAENTAVKFFKFDKTEAREFLLDGEFVSCTLYKKFDFSFFTNATIDLVGIKAKICKHVNRVLSIMKISDVITYEHDSKLRYNGVNTVFTIMVPFSDRLNLISENIYRMVKSLTDENEPVSYRIKSRAIAKIHVDKNVDNGSFFKGFTAISHEFARTDAEGKTFGDAKNYIKTGAFIDSAIGLTGKEIGQFNQYNLTLNKINLFNEKESKFENNYEYFLNFRKKFRIVVYKLFIENNKLRTETKILTISLKSQNVIQTSDQKIVVGCFVSKVDESKAIEHFRDVFINPSNGTNYLLDDTSVDPNSYEFKTFEAEIDTIDENIISGLGTEESGEHEQPVEETQAAPEETAE